MKRVFALLLVTALCALAATGCCPLLESAAESGGSPGGGISEVSAPSLDEFLDADTKTGSYSTHTEWFGGDSHDQTGEFWVDGRLFRYDIYEDGVLVRSVVSPDGGTAYFVHHEEQACEPSVASVDYYLMRYTMPDGDGIEDGIDEETGAARIVYAVQKTDDMEGAANPWYSEDVTYLVEDDVVIGVITRGAVPEDDGSIEGLDVNRELWSDVKAGVPIPAETFELPYPVQAAE
jgi:hypothetical protein